ncbi:hypothetical protein ACFOM8_17710 [Paracoccus angustae]|uniref:Uncharacterized protein n=1 Tax=Paracoccus angustae TaxID=1671480 RepID=A0ABV7U861_9RHOB
MIKKPLTTDDFLAARNCGEIGSREATRRIGHAGEHAERQHIDLHEAERVDVVFNLFDDLPFSHCGRLDRHQGIQTILVEDEPARMLRQALMRFKQTLDRGFWC